MRIDLPLCNLKTCRYCFDGNCTDKIKYEQCEYTLAKIAFIPTAELDTTNDFGEWIFKNDNPLIPTGYWECSKCKKGRLMVEENFCPNCGADMRKREED